MTDMNVYYKDCIAHFLTRIAGSLPASLSRAPIVRLDLSRNNFTGSLPPAWHFHKLISVNLNSNGLQVLRD